MLMRGLSVVYGALSLKGCEGRGEGSRCGEGLHRMWCIPRTFSGLLVGLVNVGACVCVHLV